MFHRSRLGTTIHRALGASLLSTTAVAFAAAASGAQDGSKIPEQAVSAEDVLEADVRSAGGRVVEVKDLVLRPDGSSVQYILYERPVHQFQNGFSAFDAVELFGHSSAMQVHFKTDPSSQAPDEIALTASEADHRLVSDLIDQEMHFSDGEARGVTDLLIDRNTGDVTHYVVAMDGASLFDPDRRAIPAHRVSVRDGRTLTTSTTAAGVDDISREHDRS